MKPDPEKKGLYLMVYRSTASKFIFRKFLLLSRVVAMAPEQEEALL